MKNILSILFGLFAIVAFTACSEEDNWAPGEETVPNDTKVYFDKDSSGEIILSTDDARTTTIWLGRTGDFTNELTVPIQVVSADEAINIPSSVTFAAGEEWTELEISFPNIQMAKKATFELALEEKYANHYQDIGGSSTFKGSILVAAWNKIEEKAWFKFQAEYDTIYSTVYQLEGQRRFRVENFLNCGHDLVFSVGENTLDTYGDYEIKIAENNLSYTYTYGDGSIVYDIVTYGEDGSCNWLSWCPQEGKRTISSCYAYFYYASNNTYFSYIYPLTRKGVKHLYGILYFYLTYEDGESAYNYCEFDFPASLPE